MKSGVKTIREGQWRNLPTLVCGFLVFIHLGCARPPSPLGSDQGPKEQDYGTQIQALEEAVVLAHKSGDHQAAGRYADRLQAIKLEAAADYYRQAAHYFDQAELNAASLCIHHAIRYQPDAIRHYDLKQRIESAIAETEQQHAKALTLADRSQWRQAIALLEQAYQHNHTLTGAGNDLKQLQERAYQYYIDLAETCLQQDDLDGAARQANQALTFRSDGTEAGRLLESVEDRRRAALLIDRAQDQLAQDRPEQALTWLEQAMTLQGDSSELDELYRQTKATLCGRWMNQGRKALRNQDAVTALALFLRSRDLMPDYGHVDQDMAKAKALLVRNHLQQAQGCLRQELSGAAVLHAMAAVAYSDESPESRDVLQDSINRTRQAVQLTVAFDGFTGQPIHQAIADKLNASVESRLNQQDIPGIFFKENVGHARAVISGRILEAHIRRERIVSARGKSRYEVGLRPEPNPKYTAARQEVDVTAAELDKAREQLLTAERRQILYANPDPNDPEAVQRKQSADADVIEARQRLEMATELLESASNRLRDTRPKVLVPRFADYEYPVYTVEKTAEITCAVKMTDQRTQAVLLTEQLNEQYTVSDDVIEAEPSKNVTSDPLELPEDGVVYEGAVAVLEARLQRILHKALSQHNNQFITAQHRYQALGRPSEALNSAILFLISSLEHDERSEEMMTFIRSYLGKEESWLDVSNLLRTYVRESAI